ncbi:MAG: hypothetical protein NTV28_08435, partial [Propionibacteriales bacterium]|nr:hypothetical protein [Propionibacteriales bacterium]
TRLRNAMDALDAAADTCKRAINAASGHFKDSTMDDVKGAVSAVLKVLVDALNIIAFVIAVVVIVLLVIGTGGAILAVLIPALFWIGVAVFALTAVQLAMGDADWLDLGLAFFGMIGGKIATGMAKAATRAVSAARMSVVVRAADDAIRNLPVVVRLAQRVPFAPIANWGARREGVAVYNAVMDTLSAMRPGQLNAALSRTLQGIELDGAVETLRTIHAMRQLPLAGDEILHLTQATRATIGSLTGSGMQLTAQVSDYLKLPETIRDFPDTVSDGLGAVVDAIDGAPGRSLPTSVVEVGR